MITATREAENLLKESLAELESAKGSVLTGLQRLVRAAKLLGDENVVIWCEIQFGNTKYTGPLNRKINLLQQLIEGGFDNKKTLGVREVVKKTNLEEQLKQNEETIARLGLKQTIHCSDEELAIKYQKAGGGYQNIGTIEEVYVNLIRAKQGNDGTY